jgi:hypothetical protein
MAAVSSCAAATTQSEHSLINPLSLLGLHAGLRLQIYGCLVAVGKIFDSPEPYCVDNETEFKDRELYARPSLQILRTCKQLHHETEDVYVAKNLSLHHSSITGFSALILLKNVSVSLNMRDFFPVIEKTTFTGVLIGRG